MPTRNGFRRGDARRAGAFPGRGPAAPALRLALTVAACLACLGAAPASAGPDAGSGTSADGQARIAELQRQGRIAEALTLCRQEVAAHPDDPRLRYNLACLESRGGDPRAALRSLRAALAGGFEDFDFALADPDLQGGLADSTRAVIDRWRRSRGRLSAERGVRLRYGTPATLFLRPDGPATDTAPVATLTATWVQNGLKLVVAGDDSGGKLMSGYDAAPWNGRGGLLVLLGDLGADDTGETIDCFVLGFGTEKGAGTGALVADATARWHRVRELAPKIRGLGTGALAVEAVIPWTAISPYHPLTDPALGLNVALVGPGGARRGAIVPGDVPGRLAQPRHLAARLDFDLDSAPAGLLQGHTPTTLVSGGGLAINLVATSARAGQGMLTLDFQNSGGMSLLAGGARPQPVTLVAGRNAINRAADFGQIPDGPCRISAELALPDGTTSAWSQWVLNLGPNWEARYRGAIAKLPAAEQATGRHFLQAVVEAVAAHRPRRNPGPLTTTLDELTRMLERLQATGSLIPGAGTTPFVVPGPGGADRLCRLVVPTGRPAGVPLLPVVVAGYEAVDGPRLADRILRFLDESGSRRTAAAAPTRWPVFVLAPATGDGAGAAGIPTAADLTALTAELDACTRWTREHFAADKVLLAAQGWAVAPALALARGPGVGRELLVFADRTVQPWPGADAAELDRRLGSPPPGLNVTWVDFNQETALGGQGRALRDALRRQGWRVDDERVAGSANFTQVADRVCRWESGLAAAGARGGAGRR